MAPILRATIRSKGTEGGGGVYKAFGELVIIVKETSNYLTDLKKEDETRKWGEEEAKQFQEPKNTLGSIDLPAKPNDDVRGLGTACMLCAVSVLPLRGQSQRPCLGLGCGMTSTTRGRSQKTAHGGLPLAILILRTSCPTEYETRNTRAGSYWSSACPDFQRQCQHPGHNKLDGWCEWGGPGGTHEDALGDAGCGRRTGWGIGNRTWPT